VPNTRFDRKVGVEGNVGLISSELTVPASLGKKSDLYLSARSSYIDMLYGKWLKFEGYDIDYDFQDFNATYSYRPTYRDE
jgi:hypothetical protein